MSRAARGESRMLEEYDGIAGVEAQEVHLCRQAGIDVVQASGMLPGSKASHENCRPDHWIQTGLVNAKGLASGRARNPIGLSPRTSAMTQSPLANGY